MNTMNLNNKSSSKKLNPYLVKEILEATPEKLILKLYDFAILHCQKGDMIKTNQAISELIRGLNFDDENVKEISVGLLSLYQFAQEQMRQKNYEIVLKILTELRDSWKTIFNSNNK